MADNVSCNIAELLAGPILVYLPPMSVLRATPGAACAVRCNIIYVSSHTRPVDGFGVLLASSAGQDVLQLWRRLTPIPRVGKMMEQNYLHWAMAVRFSHKRSFLLTVNLHLGCLTWVAAVRQNLCYFQACTLLTVVSRAQLIFSLYVPVAVTC